MTGVVAAQSFNSIELAAIVLATAAGSLGVSHVNDSGFWLVSRFFGMDMKTTLKTWTLSTTAVALLGFILSLGIYALGAAF